MEEKLKIEELNIDDIQVYYGNAKEHPDYQIKQIADSITKFGFNDPIAIDENNIIIEGHGRLLACKQLGIKSIPCIRLSHLTKDQKKAYIIAHNKLTMNSGFDLNLLAKEFEDMDKSLYTFTGFDEDEIKDIMSYVENYEDLQEDNFGGEIPEKTDIKTGDIYKLGNHYIMCGDSTDKKMVDSLMNGHNAKLLFTSPPYNMGANMYAEYTDDRKSQDYIDFNIDVVNKWKEYLDGYLFWNISYNSNTRWEFIEILYRLVKESKLNFLELIVWDKKKAMPIVSKQMLTRRYEDILMMATEDSIKQDLQFYYLGNTNYKAYFHKKKGRGITNYWEIDTGDIQHKLNKACFPVKLPGKAIELVTEKEDIVLDPFLGTGTTLIASEQMNRRCYGMEMDNKLVQYIINRWEEYTGKKATKVIVKK